MGQGQNPALDCDRTGSRVIARVSRAAAVAHQHGKRVSIGPQPCMGPCPARARRCAARALPGTRCRALGSGAGRVPVQTFALPRTRHSLL